MSTDVRTPARPEVSDDVKKAAEADHAENAREYRHLGLVDDNVQANGINGTSVNSAWQLHEAPIDNFRPMRVVVVGAGFSGILLAIRIPERLRNVDLCIYEKNEGIGGTWWENRYPGAACDVPSHSYQYSFNPKPDWSGMYAPSKEIREYLQQTAEKYSTTRFINLRHEVSECTWRQDEGRWHLKVRRPDGTVFDDACDVLINARGALNTKQWPSIKGLDSFQGEVMHSAGWNESYDFRDKRAGVIGVGSSAIQIIPQLQRQVGQLNCFIRGRTWISPPFAELTRLELGLESNTFSKEDLERFRKDPAAANRIRYAIESSGNNVHAITIKGSKMQVAVQEAFEKGMRERLNKKPEYFEWLRPAFAPGCRRLTPGEGFLEALSEDNVNFIRDRISHIEPQGVVTDDGKLHPLDVLVCATGFKVSSAPPFPITGLNGRTLSEHWKVRAVNYLSFAVDQFPNYFIMLGPNGGVGEGSLTMILESTADYITKAIRKMQKENIRSMVVKPERVADFLQQSDALFSRSVFMDDCESWYRKDGQGNSGPVITGLWPGGTLHCIEALRSPRWEDYEYEYVPEANGARVNQLAWLGNGWTFNSSGEDHEPTPEELSYYIRPLWQEREIGVPVFPRPEENEQFRIRPWSY